MTGPDGVPPNVRGVACDATEVRRPAGYWTSAEHAVLRHLEAVGFAQSPRVLDRDETTERLTYIAGNSGVDGWAAVASERGLREFASLLRAYHEAVSSFEPDGDVQWAFGSMSLRPGEIVCHGDFGPWNVVWRDHLAVGLLDWDFVYPGPPTDDVAYALEYAVPFRDDETCVRWLGYETPPDRKRRIALFADAYGLSTTVGLVDEVVRRQRLTIGLSILAKQHGFPVSPDWPTQEQLEERARWTEQNRELFE